MTDGPDEIKKWRHHYLTDAEKRKFKLAFRANANEHAFASFMRTPVGFVLSIAIAIGALFSVHRYVVCNDNDQPGYWNTTRNAIATVVGIIAAQITFAIDHTFAHLAFLHYDFWQQDHPMAKSMLPVMYYAFYHHHHTVLDDWGSDTWSATSSWMWSRSNARRGVVASHWHAYCSMFKFDYLLLATLFLLALRLPVLASLCIGREIGALFIVAGHGWAHRWLYIQRIPCFRSLERWMAAFGGFADIQTHKRHHRHNHPTVYQSFTSSGLYSRTLDKLFDRLWDRLYTKGCSSESGPYTSVALIHEYVPVCVLASSALIVSPLIWLS